MCIMKIELKVELLAKFLRGVFLLISLFPKKTKILIIIFIYSSEVIEL